MMNARLFSAVFAIALAFTGAGCNKSSKLNTPSSSRPAAGPVELKLKWTPGERMVQEYNMDQTMLMNIPGQAAPMKQDMTMGEKLSLTVVNAGPDGSHELEMEFLGVHAAMQTGRMNLEYDSERDGETGITNPFAKVFARLVGGKIRFFLDASNNVERMEGVDDLMARVSAGDRSGLFKSIFNEGYLKQMMSFNRFLPPNPVQPGDTWLVKLQFPTGALGTLDANDTLTFKGWEMLGKRNCARIEISGNVEIEPGGGPGPMGMTVAKGNFSGVVWFDPELRTAVDTKLNKKMTIIMTLPKTAAVTITYQVNQVIDLKVDSLII